MTEEQELQAKIAALSGRINSHKQQTQGYGRGRGSSSWSAQRGTPYGSHKVHKGRGYGPAHRNRTLVLNNTHQDDSTDDASSTPVPSSAQNSASTWVSKRDRHMQLINTSVYGQVSEQRSRDIAKTMEQKRKERDMREKAKLQKHFQYMQAQASKPDTSTAILDQGQTAYEISVEGLPFRITDGGSKLVRVRDGLNASAPTPKKAIVAGVTFFRSKHGNLYRAGLVKTKKKNTIQKIAELCPMFSSTGHCVKGPSCRYVHDPHKVAICKDYLAKGICPLGDACDLSHQPSPHRVPACLHFLRGNCTNDDCRYAHIRVNPAAPVCRAFARLGYCEKGAECADRHVFECPDYANKGLCRKTDCRLPHVDRAGQIRRAAAVEGSDVIDMAESIDLSSDEDDFDNSDDVDSDDLEEIFGDDEDPDSSHGLSQQQDFIQF